MIGAGSCASHNCGDILTMDACQAASGHHGLVRQMTYSRAPQGCIRGLSGSTYFNTASSAVAASVPYKVLCHCHINLDTIELREKNRRVEQAEEADFRQGCVDQDEEFCASVSARSCKDEYYYRGKKISSVCSKTCGTCNAAQLRGSAAKLAGTFVATGDESAAYARGDGDATDWGDAAV